MFISRHRDPCSIHEIWIFFFLIFFNTLKKAYFQKNGEKKSKIIFKNEKKRIFIQLM